MRKRSTKSLYDYESVGGLDCQATDKDGNQLPESVSLTQQCFKDSCEIKNIIESAPFNGNFMEELNKRAAAAQYGDFTHFDYQTMQNQVAMARSQFEQLPSEVRDRFDSQPEKLYDFLADEKNYEEAVKLGLLPQREEIKQEVKPDTVLTDKIQAGGSDSLQNA